MRSITAKAITAFVHNRSFRLANTSVHVDTEPAVVYLKLHGHTIAQKNIDTGEIKITTAGWNTRTTRDRLNGLPGVRVFNKKHQLYIATANHPTPVEWDGFLTAIFAVIVIMGQRS